MIPFLYTPAKHGNPPNAASRASGTMNSDSIWIAEHKSARFVLARAKALRAAKMKKAATLKRKNAAAEGKVSK